jgi:transcription antitermination factor NusG
MASLFTIPVDTRAKDRMKRQQLHPLAFGVSSGVKGTNGIMKRTQTREALTVGKIVMIIAGEFKGHRAVVVDDEGAGIIKVSGSGVPCMKIDQDLVIATKKTTAAI